MPLYLQRADQDIQIETAVTIQIAHRAGIGAARCWLELVDDFHAAHLGTAGNGAAWEYRPDRVARQDLGSQPAAHIGDDVMHVGIALDHHQFVHRHRTGLADTPDVIALEIDQHHVLGPLLRVSDQLSRQTAIGARIGAAWSGTRDRPGLGDAATELQQTLGRGTHYREIVPA